MHLSMLCPRGGGGHPCGIRYDKAALPWGIDSHIKSRGGEIRQKKNYAPSCRGSL